MKPGTHIFLFYYETKSLHVTFVRLGGMLEQFIIMFKKNKLIYPPLRHFLGE